MEIRESFIKGLVEITPKIFKDERGYFFESFSKRALQQAGIYEEFVQDNQSFSTPGVIRGLHFQRAPFGQAKLVRVVKGKALDVAVDLRKGSPTFGQYDSVILDAEKNNMFYVPDGFAHGFSALEETVLLYKCTNFYNKESECGIRFDDPQLKINWCVNTPLVSDKDKELKFLADLIAEGIV
jgi:dTDP-4-dehydrorhamnose 3,5-epimerase